MLVIIYRGGAIGVRDLFSWGGGGGAHTFLACFAGITESMPPENLGERGGGGGGTHAQKYLSSNSVSA